MVKPAADVFDIPTSEILDYGWLFDEGIAFAGAGGDAGLAEIVEAPGVDLAFSIDCETVERAAGDVFYIVSWEIDPRWFQGFLAVRFHYVAA